MRLPWWRNYPQLERMGSTVCQWGCGREEAGQGEGLLLLMEGLGFYSEELQSPTETPTRSLAHSLTLEE